MQPWPHFSGRKFHIGFGPFARPGIFVTVELSAAHPVAQGQFMTVLDPHTALFRRVDHEQATQAPERLTAQKAFGFLINHDHLFAAVAQFGRRGQTGQTATNNNCICGGVGHERSFQRLRNQMRNGSTTAYIVIP